MLQGYRLRAYFTEQEWNETPAERKLRLMAERAAIGERVVSKEQTWAEVGEAVAVPKGSCPKCGKHIGRGVAFHIKACKGG